MKARTFVLGFALLGVASFAAFKYVDPGVIAALPADQPQIGATPDSRPKPEVPNPSDYKISEAGDVVEGTTFRLRLLPPTEAAAPGKKTKLQVELEAKPPWHVNLEYPVTVRMEKSDDWQETPLEVTSEKALEYTQSRARLALEISANKNGRFPVLTEVAFAMCTKELCTLEKQRVKTTVTVQ